LLGWIKKILSSKEETDSSKWYSGPLGTYLEFPHNTVDNKEIDSRKGTEGSALPGTHNSSKCPSTNGKTANGGARISLGSYPPPLPRKIDDPGFWNEELGPEYFDDLVEEIKDEGLRKVTQDVVAMLPKWFWIEPASMSGRYHPPDSNGRGGNARHSKKVAIIARDLGRTHDLDPDILIVAGLLHDCAKRGVEDEAEPGNNGPSFKDHGRIGAEWLLELFPEVTADKYNSPEDYRKWDLICSCVETHMGKWGPRRPRTNYQRVIHYSDMFASNKHFILLDNLRRKGVMS